MKKGTRLRSAPPLRICNATDSDCSFSLLLLQPLFLSFTRFQCLPDELANRSRHLRARAREFNTEQIGFVMLMVVLYPADHEAFLTYRHRQGKPQLRGGTEGDGLGENALQTAFRDFGYLGSYFFRILCESNHAGTIERDTLIATSILFVHGDLIPV